MTQRDKLIAKILAWPPEADCADVRALLEMFGWIFDRQKGSHTYWNKPGERSMSIPLVSGRKVKRHYLDVIGERLDLDT